MVEKLVGIIKTARPRQWVKNFTLYAALLFTGNVFTQELWVKEFWVATSGVIVFTIIASAVYFLNDVVDVEADREHPFKKKRPIAAGKVTVTEAMIVCIILASSGLIWASKLTPLFGIVVAGYLVLQLLYSFWLKNVEVVDVFVIGLGFFLRVLAGAIVINAHLSIWFLLCVVSTSLFLAVGKRRAELSIMTEQTVAVKHRKVMGKYSAGILDAYLSMFATSAFLSWALFTFNFYDQSDPTSVTSILVPISRTLTIDKWLMATIPVVIFGIMRYIRIVYDGSRAESPERVILSDLPLLGSVGLWALMVVIVLYGV